MTAKKQASIRATIIALKMAGHLDAPTYLAAVQDATWSKGDTDAVRAQEFGDVLARMVIEGTMTMPEAFAATAF